jgi:serine/threonine protein kinase
VPANLLLKWARQICHALKELHALIPPVIHRDLKPDNILLGVDRNVRVVDFGLAAKLLHNGYVPGVAGTIDYMAPETTRGESVPASDVYSVGLILYKGLTGRLPFEHLIPPLNQPDALHSDWLYKQKGRLIPTPPAHLNNSVTSELSDTIMRCLEFRPSQRFFDAGELLDALEEKEQEEPPDVRALTEGRQMKGAGELQEARLMFERGLGAASGSTPTRFHLLCELGEVLLRMGDHKAAAARLADAWALVKDTGILSRLQERIDLLGRIAAAYSGCGNSYQAGIYERLKSEELKKMRL